MSAFFECETYFSAELLRPRDGLHPFEEQPCQGRCFFLEIQCQGEGLHRDRAHPFPVLPGVGHPDIPGHTLRLPVLDHEGKGPGELLAAPDLPLQDDLPHRRDPASSPGDGGIVPFLRSVFQQGRCR